MNRTKRFPSAPMHESHNPRQRMTERRRALSDIGGEVQTSGDPTTCARLTTVLSEDFDADTARIHLHGFHTYPARMHPAMARRAIELFSPVSGIVLDPFCGSGTVLLEAQLAARSAIGADLNPLAVILAQFKTTRFSKTIVRNIAAACKAVVRHADDRRKLRVGATRRYSQQDVSLFAPHVLLELDSLRDGIEQLEAGIVADGLWLVLSSMLVKLSAQPSDTTPSGKFGTSSGGPWPRGSQRSLAGKGKTAKNKAEQKKFAAGFAIRSFEQKTRELLERIAFCEKGYGAISPNQTKPCHVYQTDAREFKVRTAGSIHLMLTSPPYVGTYDYVEHHQTRMRWLGLSPAPMQQGEIGARRQARGRSYDEVVSDYTADMQQVLTNVKHALAPSGRAILVIADSVVNKQAVNANELIKSCAQAAGLEWLATASQPRKLFYKPGKNAFGKDGNGNIGERQEHVIVLAKS